MTTNDPSTLTRLQSHLQGMKATQTRLQEARTALAGGVFDPPADTPANAQEAMQTLAQRLRANSEGRMGTMGDLVDAVQQVQQEQVVQDIQDSMHRMDALRRFSASHAKTHYASQAAATQTAPPATSAGQPTDQVIDVEAKVVSPSTTTT